MSEREVDWKTLVMNIRDHNWQQGSLIEQKDFDEAVSYIPSLFSTNLETDFFLIVSHDCDLVNWDLDKEPFVELMLVHKVETPDGNKQFGRNSRTLQITLKIDETEQLFELTAFEKFLIPRKLLANKKPSNTKISAQEIRAFKFWLANRYNRPAFPDMFNDRLSKRENRKHREKAIKAFKSPEISRLARGVYLLLEPNSDLGE